jgi:hypothetical protein
LIVHSDYGFYSGKGVGVELVKRSPKENIVPE